MGRAKEEGPSGKARISLGSPGRAERARSRAPRRAASGEEESPSARAEENRTSSEERSRRETESSAKRPSAISPFVVPPARGMSPRASRRGARTRRS